MILTIATIIIMLLILSAFSNKKKPTVEFTEEMQDTLKEMPVAVYDRISQAIYYTLNGKNQDLMNLLANEYQITYPRQQQGDCLQGLPLSFEEWANTLSEEELIIRRTLLDHSTKQFNQAMQENEEAKQDCYQRINNINSFCIHKA